MYGIILSALGGIGKEVLKYLRAREATKRVVKTAKQRRKQAELRERLRQSRARSQMDQMSTRAMGWMNTLSFLALGAPAVLVFFPSQREFVEEGFKALQSVPDWYKAVLGLMLVQIWGYRSLVVPIIRARYGLGNPGVDIVPTTAKTDKRGSGKPDEEPREEKDNGGVAKAAPGKRRAGRKFR